MSELALKLIRENIEKHRRGEYARFLDLGNCGMTEVPEEIGECVWVEKLNLSKNEELIGLSSLMRLWTLTQIDLSYTQVSDLSALTKLWALQELDLSVVT